MYICAEWVIKTQTRISTLEARVEDARLNSVSEEKKAAILEISQRANELADLMDSRQTELHLLQSKIDTSFASVLERINATESKLSAEQESSLGTFEVMLRQEIETSESRFNSIISNKTRDFIAKMDFISAAEASVSTTARQTEELAATLRTEQAELKQRVSDFEGLVRTYQSFTETRLDATIVPSGSITFLTEDMECPPGYTEYARTLFHVFEDDKHITGGGRDFLSDSTYDIGLRNTQGQQSKQFVSIPQAGHSRSYDGFQIRTCKRK